ncbi:hypothetical protein CBR_g3041 [Chara braunii]|uniref:Uncharacterized protein n=1 Tax=Chara braunii TaxID=69332 RepID=A0A388KER7_CHABU|nr:hypothetical protein CBR_g3041 [Chara braunii]|eukprot:GBG68497.1 hypothetical protein CBR_g3041 [Chara braunii]
MAAEKQVLVRTFLVLSFVSVASISVIYFLSLRPVDSNAAAAPSPPESVCWNGPALFESHPAVRQSTPAEQQQQQEEDISLPTHDSSSPASSPSLDDVPHGRATGALVQIVGVGCRSCYVGSTCSFDVRLSSGAYWQDSELTRRRELMVKIDGPSLLEGAALPVISSVSGLQWSVSYTPFDAGVYVVTVYAECAITSQGERNGSLFFSDPIEKMHNESTNTIAEFRLTVYEEPSREGGGALCPCDGGIYGRWLPASPPNKDNDHHVSKNNDNDNDNDNDNGDAHNDVNVNDDDDDGTSGGSTNGHVASFRWQFFDCAKQVDALEFVAAMASKGIGEISFVGDSHNRRLYHHVCFLLTGHVNSSERVAQIDLSRHVSLVGEGGRRSNLTLRFLFVPGIWDGSGAYGCPLDSFGRRKEPPNLPSTGLFVFNAAHWEYELCLEPEMAYARYLPTYLEWGRRLAKQEGARLVWRSTTPFNVRTWGCSWGIFPRQRNYTAWRRRENGQGGTYLPPLGRTNAGFRLANEFAKRAADVAGFQYYDSWQVEAPFYFDSSSKDCHYSQVTSDGRMRGIVGEAVARDFMSWAATRMR